MTERVRIVLAAAFAGFALVIFAAAASDIFVIPWRPDYSVFWAAARFVTEGKAALVYDDSALSAAQAWLNDPRGVRPFAYPPTALLPLLPFATLPFYASYWVWASLCGLAFLVAAWPIVGRSPLAIALTSFSFVFYMAFRHGQFVLLVGALLMFALPRIGTKPALAGLLLGIAASLKPQMLVFVPVALIAVGNWRALAYSVVGGAGMFLLSLILGPHLWLDWLEATQRFMATVDSLHILKGSSSPTGLLRGYGAGGAALAALNILLAIGGTYMVWRVFRLTDEPAVQLGALVAGALLASPYAMIYDMAALAPVGAYFITRLDDIPKVIGGGAALIAKLGLAVPCLVVFVVALVWRPRISAN